MQRSKWQFTPQSLQLCFQSRTMAAQGAATNFQMSSARRPPHKKLTLKPFTFYLSNKSTRILNHLDFQIPPIHYQFWSDLIFVIFSPQMFFLGSIFLHMKVRKLWQNLPKFIKISQKFPNFPKISPQI